MKLLRYTVGQTKLVHMTLGNTSVLCTSLVCAHCITAYSFVDFGVSVFSLVYTGLLLCLI